MPGVKTLLCFPLLAVAFAFLANVAAAAPKPEHVVIVTSAKTDEEAKVLLEQFDMPFRN